MVHKNSVLVVIAQVFSVALYLFLGQWTDFTSQPVNYWLLITVLYLIYGFYLYLTLNNRLSGRYLLIILIIGGAIARISLIPADPLLSDDVYRYLWDGKIFAAGLNPYHFAPMAEELLPFRDQVIFPLINFPEIATVYPPVAQLFFLLNDWLGGTLLSWKLILLLTETGLLVVLFRLLNHFQLDPYRLLIFYLNPLVIIEVYHSGHLELIGIFFFWLAVYLFYRFSYRQSVLIFPVAIMTKFVPLLSAIPFLLKRFWYQVIIILFLCLIFVVPFALNGVIPLPGLFSYLNRWEFNGAIYQLAMQVMNWINLPSIEWGRALFSGHQEIFYLGPPLYYKLFMLLVLAVVMIDQGRKIMRLVDYKSIIFIQRSFLLTATFLLLTPTLHPWYLLWIIPYLIFLPNLAWIFFTFLIQFSYAVLEQYITIGLWHESLWIMILQYVPFYIILIWEFLDKRRIKGWLIR